MQVHPSLIKGCKERNRKSQYHLYDECYSYLLRICLRYHKQREDAVEILNTGFMKILENIDKYTEEKPFDLWIRRIMINHIIDNFRRTASYKQTISYVIDEITEEKSISWNEAENQFNVKDILAMINELPDVSRQVFNLYIMDGYSHKEIGEMLDISDGTSRWHLNHARKKLQEKIKNPDVKNKAVTHEQ